MNEPPIPQPSRPTGPDLDALILTELLADVAQILTIHNVAPDLRRRVRAALQMEYAVRLADEVRRLETLNRLRVRVP